jgi:hypothetical protein
MRASLEVESQFFWKCAKAVRAKLGAGTLTEDDEDLDEIIFTEAYTEHESVRELCREILEETRPVQQLRNVG